jgi:hypothetical protein
VPLAGEQASKVGGAEEVGKVEAASHSIIRIAAKLSLTSK